MLTAPAPPVMPLSAIVGHDPLVASTRRLVRSALLLAGLAGPAALAAQEVLWSRTYGAAEAQAAYTAAATADGGFVLFGYDDTSQPGDATLGNLLLLKTDSEGNEEWSRLWGGPYTDWGFSVRQLPDGGYVLAGMWGTQPQSQDAYLARADEQGNLVWGRQYGESGVDERAHSVWPTADGGFVFAGQKRVGVFPFDSYDVWLVKTDAEGDVVWEQLFSLAEGDNDVGLAVQETAGGGYIIGGMTQSQGWACYLVRTDGLGNLVWQDTYGGGWAGGECNDVVETPDGGFLGAGCATPSGDCQLYLVRTDANGEIVWERNYGGPEGDDVAQSLLLLPGGDFAVAGQTSTEGAGGWDVWVLRADPEGNLRWTQTFGGDSDDRGWTVMPTADGDLAVAGWFAYPPGENWLDLLLVKLDDSAPIFADGFESGDTSAWGDVVP